MSIFHRFERGDQTFYRLDVAPRVELASGSGGWRSSIGSSGSIGLHGGYRDRPLVLEDDGIKIDCVVNIDSPTSVGAVRMSASYPMTGSVSFVKVRDVDGSSYGNDWYASHFDPIMRLYDYYSSYDVDYVTSSYDFYSLFSLYGSNNRVLFTDSAQYDHLSSSYTVEARIKPFSVTGSDDYTIVERSGSWRFYIEGASSKLAFSASDGSQSIYTSSIVMQRDAWQHVAFQAGSNSGTFLIDMIDVGTIAVTGNLDSSTGGISLLGIYDGGTSFHGMIEDVKIWSVKRTWQQLSSSFDRTMQVSSSTDLKLYARSNDGPLSIRHGKSIGSGSFDHSYVENHGTLTSFDDRSAPVWHPSDDKDFVTTKNLCGDSISMLKVLHLPSMYYGRSIMTGSVRMTCNAFMSCSLIRTLVDDGRGGLYLSGSACSSSLADKNDYYGVVWPKVGNVFYDEGLVVIKDPSLLDFAEDFGGTSQMPNDLLQVSFVGQTTKPVKVLSCRSNVAEDNCSKNKTFSKRDANGKLRVIRDDPTTYITTIGIYNEEYKLVAVARMAEPIRKREKDKLNFRVKIDF